MKKSISTTILILLLPLLCSCFQLDRPINSNQRNSENVAEQIKNIIYLIPDGAGWGNYDFGRSHLECDY